MNTKMNDFELLNEDIDQWTETQFVEADPMQNNNQELCEIVLCVDWENKNSFVETRMNDNSTPAREWYGLDECFHLPENMDAAEFKTYYDEKIKPMLQKRGKDFDTYWDGSNLRGRFKSEFDDDRYIDEVSMSIQDTCNNSPEHEVYVCFSILDSCQDDNDVVEVCELYDIDFMTADLDNMTVVDEIMSYLSEEVIFINVDAQYELKDIQERLN